MNLSFLLLACGGQPLPPPPGSVAPARFADVTASAPDSAGLSGLAQDGAGVLWSVTERGLGGPQSLVPFAWEDGQMRLETGALPIEGLAAGQDAEALAWLEEGRFAVGTERDEGRAEDEVLGVGVEGGRAAVRQRIPVPYSLWGMAGAESNHGIEGLCAAGGRLLAAAEDVRQDGRVRRAPLARWDGESWTPFFLHLTSETGKISALDCRAAEGALEVIAIERHYEVSRLLRFLLPETTESGATLVPLGVIDLAPFLAAEDNLEGVAWAADGSFVLITDSSSGRGAIPTIMLRLAEADARWQAP